MNTTTLVEYLNLGYTPGHRDSRLTDKMLNPTTLLRSTEEGDTVYYLTSGDTLFIPYRWIDLFEGLYLYGGNLILFKPYYGKDYMEDFIQVWMKYEKDRSLDGITDLCILGTGKFRDWLSKEHGIELGPFILTTDYNNILEI